MYNKINISPQKQKLLIYIILTIVTLAVFLQVNQYDFVFDDIIYVTENSHIKSGITLEGLGWAFSTAYADLWHPLVWLSFMFDYQLYGLNPGGYHFTNLILHILSTLLLFWFFNRMTGMIWRSAFVAAIFALHPLHVESVAWIAERKDVLSAFFWMLTLCIYVYYTEKPVIKRYLLVLFSFVLALMSKPMVITLPLIMILLDYWPLKRFGSKNIESNLTEIVSGKGPLWPLWEKIPFLILSISLVVITLYTPNNSNNPDITQFPLSSRLANAPVSFVTYLEKTFWPHDMAVFYPFSDQLFILQVFGATLLIIVISAAVIIMARRLPYLFVGWLWYAITIAPVLGIIQISLTTPYSMADRYHYLPSIGIAVMLAWGIPSLIKNKNVHIKILFPVTIAFFTILSVFAWQQCHYWKNGTTLFSQALRVTKINPVMHNNLGLTLFNEGKTDEAIYHYNEAIRIKTNYVDAYYNRGIANFQLVRYQLAIEDFNQAIRLNHSFAKAYNNRGAAYFNLGQNSRAVEDFNEAISLKADYADAYNNRALVCFIQGNHELACHDAKKACASGNCRTLKVAKFKGFCR